MTTSSKVLSIALFSIFFFFFLFFLSANLLFAGTKWPTVSGSVRATATVVNPIGITTAGINIDPSDEELWLIRYPSADGLRMVVQLNGDIMQTIKLDETLSFGVHDTFSLIKPPEQLLGSVQSVPRSQNMVVITLISTTQ